MKNLVERGETIRFTAGADLTSGDLVVVGNVAVVVVNTVASGEEAVGFTNGVFEVPKLAASVFTQGDSVNYLTSTKAVQSVAPGSGDGFTGVGVCWKDAAATTTTVEVRLNTYIASPVA